MKKGGKALILGLSIASGALLAPVIASAQIDITVAPPEPRAEVVPGPRAGYVWAPGYWGLASWGPRVDRRSLDCRAPGLALGS
jgi:hypothetical protein